MSVGMDSESAPLKTMPSCAARAIVTLLSYAMISGGLGVLFGFAAAAVGLGTVLWLDATIDEVVERFTGVKRV